MPKKSGKKASRSQIMKAIWAKRKAQPLSPIIKTDHRRLPAGTPIAEGWKVVDHADELEAENRRRDKELLAEEFPASPVSYSFTGEPKLWKTESSLDHLEAELHRRDLQLIAEWRRAIADTRPKQIYGGAVIVPWSTVDAILKLLPTE